MSARVIVVIVTDMEHRGEGVPDNPYRRVTQFWSLDGNLLAESDTWLDRHLEKKSLDDNRKEV